MKNAAGRVKSAIVLAGGAGGRLHSITRGKVSKANILLQGKPLLGRQLGFLKSLGIKKVTLVVKPDKKHEFEAMIESGQYPKMSYTLVDTPFEAPGYKTRHVMAKVFQQTPLGSFVGNEPVIVTFADAYYFPRFLKRALSDFAAKKRSLFLAQPMQTTSPVKQAFHEKVFESGAFPESGYQPAFSGFIATPAFFDFFCNRIASNRTLTQLIKEAGAEHIRVGVMHGQIINVNGPADYLALREILAGKLSFPFPSGWIKKFRRELESITGRPEDRASHKLRVKDARRHIRRRIKH